MLLIQKVSFQEDCICVKLFQNFEGGNDSEKNSEDYNSYDLSIFILPKISPQTLLTFLRQTYPSPAGLTYLLWRQPSGNLRCFSCQCEGW